MITIDEIVQAVNDAGFQDATELTSFLKVANLRVERGRVDAEIALRRQQQTRNNAQAESEIQALSDRGRAIDAEIGSLIQI